MKYDLPVVAASMVMGSFMLVFSSWNFFDNYIQFSTVLYPPGTTFGDIYTVIIQMVCHAAAIITGTVQILSAFEFIRAATRKEHDDNDLIEAFQVWFGTLINLFLLDGIIFLLVEAMNWSQSNVMLHSQPTSVGINLCFMAVIFVLTCCVPCKIQKTPDNIVECYQNNAVRTHATVVNECEKGEKFPEKSASASLT